MNMNQLLNMIFRMLTRRAMNWTMNKGVSSLSRSGGPAKSGVGTNRTAREAAKRARQAAQITRRMGR